MGKCPNYEESLIGKTLFFSGLQVTSAYEEARAPFLYFLF